jgi:hypothetical protein
MSITISDSFEFDGDEVAISLAVLALVCTEVGLDSAAAVALSVAAGLLAVTEILEKEIDVDLREPLPDEQSAADVPAPQSSDPVGRIHEQYRAGEIDELELERRLESALDGEQRDSSGLRGWKTPETGKRTSQIERE